MTDKEYLNLALAKMHTSQWYGFNSKEQNYSTLIVHNSSITKPTESDVNAKIQELKDDETARVNKKKSAKTKLKALGLDDAELKTLGL